MTFPYLNPSSIWNCRQNKPSHIVRDLKSYVDPDTVYETLLRRGVFKWLAVRRELIRLKEEWKERLKIADVDCQIARRSDDRYYAAYMKGYRQALRECRQEVRALCHSPRWQVPDHDREAQRWLDSYSAGEIPKV